MKKYKNIIFAGTFDHFHIGHKTLLNKAFEIAEKVSIWVTTEELYKNKVLSQLIPSYVDRKMKVESYLDQKGLLSRASFYELNSIYGSSTKSDEFDSILVTKITRANAEKINAMRKERGHKKLAIVEEALVRGDDGEVVTSERIRSGQIDPEGNSYIHAFKKKKMLRMPEAMREELRKPLGQVFEGTEESTIDTAKEVVKSIRLYEPTMVVSVGDVVSLSMSQVHYHPDVKIVDLKSRRKDFVETHHVKGKAVWQAQNDPGTISTAAVESIKTTFEHVLKTHQKQTLIIQGEEDLLALPAILLAPLGSLVLYGQWNLGVIMVEINREKKEEVKRLLGRFTIQPLYKVR